MVEIVVGFIIVICLAAMLGPSKTPKEKARDELKKKNEARRALEKERIKQANLKLKDRKKK